MSMSMKEKKEQSRLEPKGFALLLLAAKKKHNIATFIYAIFLKWNCLMVNNSSNLIKNITKLC